jgi:lipopolysaccharide transport system ATP-binding protein
VLFVSHNLPAVETLCTRGILLDRGSVTLQSDMRSTVREYQRRIVGADASSAVSLDAPRPHSAKQIFRSASLLDETEGRTHFIPLSSKFHLRLGLEVDGVLHDPVIGIGIDDTLGQRILTVHTPLSRSAIERLEGSCEVDCTIPQLPLVPGEYSVKLAFAVAGCELDSVERALQFSVIEGDAFGEGRGHRRGVCIAPSVWNLRSRVTCHAATSNIGIPHEN